MGKRCKLGCLLALTLSWASAAAAQDDAPQEEGLSEDAPQEEGMLEEEDLDVEGSSATGGSGDVMSPGMINVFGGLRLGVGGGIDSDPGGDDDLIATFGLQAGAEYILLDYLALGGELRVAWLNSKGGDDFDHDRFKLFDFVVRPRGRYVIENIGLEVYGTLPLGLTVPSIPDDWATGVEGKAGFTLGIGAGAIYMLTGNIGVNGEMIWLKHWFGTEQPKMAGNPTTHVTTGQFNFVGNVVFLL